jgi:hypothetical protein
VWAVLLSGILLRFDPDSLRNPSRLNLEMLLERHVAPSSMVVVNDNLW